MRLEFYTFSGNRKLLIEEVTYIEGLSLFSLILILYLQTLSIGSLNL